MQFSDSVTRSFLEYSSPSWRNAYPTANINKFVDYQDPTYVGFYVRFIDIGKKPLANSEYVMNFDEWPGGLFYDESHPDSAIAYLINIGEYTRAQMLREFIDGMKMLSEKLPWYFLKVSGLEEIWKIDTAESFRGKDKKIVFDMLESIDLKITYLMDLYRKATFDSIYMRHMLPENLRHFEMELVITEIRSMQRPSSSLPPTNNPNAAEDIENFKNPLKSPSPFNINIPGLTERGIQNAINAVVPNTQWASGFNRAVLSTLNRDSGSYSNFPVLLQDFNELATFLVFHFSGCEFLAFEEAPTYFASLSKIPDTVATNKMAISTPIIREYNTYGLLGAIVKDTVRSSDRNSDKVDPLFWKKTGSNSVQGVTPAEELAYLDGIKREYFDNLNVQRRHQNELREENARLGGLLGNLVNAATTVGRSAANRVVQDLVSQSLLGNVYRNVFPPPIAEEISRKVALEAPPIIKEALASVALGEDFTPPVISGGVELDGPAIGSPSASKVELTGANGPTGNTQPVELVAPPIISAISTSVELNGPAIPDAAAARIILEGPPLAPPTSTKVNLEETEKAAAITQKVNLAAATVEPSSPGKTELTGFQLSTTGSESVDLAAPPILESNLEKASLVGPPIGTNPPAKINLEGPTISDSVPGSVSLEGPNISETNLTNVDLESSPIKQENISSVELISTSSVTNINPKVDLESSPTNRGLGAKQVELESFPIQDPELSKVPLIENRVNNDIQKTVELDAPEISDKNPGGVDLDEPGSKLVDEIGKVPLKSPKKPSDNTDK